MTGDFNDIRNPIADRLTAAIDELQKNVQQVEIWAGALAGYAQPPAEYPIDRYRLPSDRGSSEAAPSSEWSGRSLRWDS